MPGLRLTLIEGRRAYVVALGAGAVLSFAFPEPSFWVLSWFCIAPLLLVLDRAGAARGARLGFLFGLGFLGLLIQWISIIGYLGYVVLVLMQSCFFAAFGAGWGTASNWGRGVAYRLIVPAAMWVAIVEFARSIFPVFGFTWGQLAQSQHNAAWFLSTAGIGGSWLTAALLIAANGLLLLWIIRPVDGVAPGRATVILTAVIVGCWLWPRPVASDDPLRVAIVQGNIPRSMSPSYEKDRIIIDNHVQLTTRIQEEVDLIVWAESSVGVDPYLDREVGELLAATARAAGVPMVVGGNLETDDGKYQVMAYLLSPEGEIVDRYQKTHLVPFGEYVPARDLLDFIPALDQVPRDAVAGDEITLFDVDGQVIATAISFEADFGSLVRDRIAAGGRALIVDTNTSTWLDSWASAQHFAMSQVRAAENGVPVIHAALTGISGFISSDGVVVDRTELWEGSVLIEDVYPSLGITPYARLGDIVPFICVALSIGLPAVARKRYSGTVAR